MIVTDGVELTKHCGEWVFDISPNFDDCEKRIAASDFVEWIRMHLSFLKDDT